MDERELNLDQQDGYPCPKCRGTTYEIVNWAATSFIVNTSAGKGVKHIEFDIQKIGGKETLTIPGLRYEMTCINCGYKTSPEELGMIRPQVIPIVYPVTPYLPLNINLGSVTLTGRVEFTDNEWAVKYTDMSIARNTTSRSILDMYSNCDHPVLRRMAEKRLKELEDDSPCGSKGGIRGM